ncbi:hypothetical protein WDW86_07600 [Bdellovibrionota bacterium FG-2]
MEPRNRSALLRSLLHDLPATTASGQAKALFTPQTSHAPVCAPAGAPDPQTNGGISSCFFSLRVQITERLFNQVSKLQALNPGRRVAVFRYLCTLSGMESAPENIKDTGDFTGWIAASRTAAQELALKKYLEEVATIFLGQSLVLKAWSDRGLRSWSEQDLGRLNWALSSALKPYVPLDREGWWLTNRNIYSWFNPDPEMQQLIWKTLAPLRIAHEGPDSLLALLTNASIRTPKQRLQTGYDPRFFSALWENSLLGEESAPPVSRKNKLCFSPTLRDGAVVRTGSVSLSWLGFESNPFQLALTELAQLWWGPSTPPLWTLGSGLEAHPREQVNFAMISPKPTLTSQVADIESCDFAFVVEECAIRTQGKSLSALHFKEELENFPYFGKLKEAGTTQGDLQACVALSKVRPGGLFWWARETPLSPTDGKSALGFLLDKAKMAAEWDFSAVEALFSVKRPLFPSYLYLFVREPETQKRLLHRPLRITASGVIRSHVEVAPLLKEALNLSTANGEGQNTHIAWKIQKIQSPTSQREWLEHWPLPTSMEVLKTLEKLKTGSIPLANLATVRAFNTDAPMRAPVGALPSCGIWVQSCLTPTGERSLDVRPLRAGTSPLSGNGLIILFPNETWIAPLSAYLSSKDVTLWLDHHAERKQKLWALSEQGVRWIPIPKNFANALSAQTSFATPLPGPWERIASELGTKPQETLEFVNKAEDSAESQNVKAMLYVRASRLLEQAETRLFQLRRLVSPAGRIQWAELLRILPKGESVSFTLHPGVSLSGNLPNHHPITQIQQHKSAQKQILLFTEAGAHLEIQTEQAILSDMLMQQLETTKHPTWSELTSEIRLPRTLELAETTAAEVIDNYKEQTKKIGLLRDFLGSCPLY